MKDPFVEEIRGYRMEHARRFNFDIHAICNDLRDLEKNKDKKIKNNFNKSFHRDAQESRPWIQTLLLEKLIIDN